MPAIAEPDNSAPQDAPGMLDVTALCRMFEEAEEASMDARKQSERDTDYYDNKQHTSEELATLSKRGQPPAMDNIVKSKIDYLVGLEKSQRVKPRALPRTPVHEADAAAAGEGMRYVTDGEFYSKKRSGVWKDLLIKGAGGIAVAIEACECSNYVSMGGPGGSQMPALPGQAPEQVPGQAQQPQAPRIDFKIKLRRIPWDRMFADPHSSEPDYSDANYLGVVVWMDYDDALAQYGDESKEALDYTLASVSNSDTYDDKPKFNLWADKKRKRVRVVQMWIKRDGEWYFAEFTKGGILKAGPSPYKTDTGESDCELIFQSAYVNRDNERYGLVREMIMLQDEVNKRRSKSLHLINVNQLFYEEGAVNDPEKARREVAKPDGTIAINPGFFDKFKVERHLELADAHFKLLLEAKNALDTKGPNATMLGDKTGGSDSASGKAIIASQQGGMMEIGDLLDGLRDLDLRVFRAIWNRIRQYWTAQKWLRVTDDEKNVKWVGLNVDPQLLQQAQQQSPEVAKKIVGVIGNVAELDCDIIIDEAPDSLTPQLEQFQTLAALKQFDAKGELPFRVIVQAAPNLKDKDKLLEMMDKASGPQSPEQAQEQQAAKDLEFRNAAAKVAGEEAGAELKRAQAAKTAREAMMPPEGGAPQAVDLPDPLAGEQALADLHNTVADTALKEANRLRTLAQTQQAHVQTELAPAEFQARRDDSAERAKQMAQRAAQRPQPSAA